jgi:hypothetical protein
MEISFQDRATAWRGRGRPPRKAPAKVLELLRHTAATGKVAVIPLEGDEKISPEEVREFVADLRAAERQLGGKVRHQIIDNALRFHWERG